MRQVGEYCVHVARDGREVRIQGKPDYHPVRLARIETCGVLRVHHVRLYERVDGALFEETMITSVEIYDPWLTIITPKAHGVGWTIFNDRSDNYTIWRRTPPNYGGPIYKTAGEAEDALRAGAAT